MKSQSRIEAARARSGTSSPEEGSNKSNKAQKIPLSPAAFPQFLSASMAILRHQLKKPPIIGFAPNMAGEKIRGTGYVLRSGALSIGNAICNGKGMYAIQQGHHGIQEGKDIFH